MDDKTNGFWGTFDLLVGRECKRTGKDVLDDVGNWLNTFPGQGQGQDKNGATALNGAMR